MIRVHLAYEGTTFHGWQRQPGTRTVEGQIIQALAKLWNCSTDEVEVQGASRTDAGVHALGQVVSFDDEGRGRNIWDYVRGLNALTSSQITINHAERIDDFNARHDSRGKLYRYRIWNHRWAHPLRLNRMWLHPGHLDLDRMRAAAEHLLGEHEFDAFRAVDCQARTTRRRITRVSIEADDHSPEIIIEVEGTAFLKYMVRIMVGTLADVGYGQIEPDELPAIIASKDRGRAGQTAPPDGLTLVRIFYPDHPWQVEPFVGLKEVY